MHNAETIRLIAAGRANTSHEGTGRFSRPLAHFDQKLVVSEKRMMREAAAEAVKPLAERTFAEPAGAEI